MHVREDGTCCEANEEKKYGGKKKGMEERLTAVVDYLSLSSASHIQDSRKHIDVHRYGPGNGERDEIG